MNNKKNNIIIIISVILLIAVIIFLLINKQNHKEYKVEEIDYKTLTEKIENKETFVLVFSQTTCSHCVSYKPILKQVAKKYKLDNIYYLDYDIEDEKKQEKIKTEFNFDGGTPTTIFFKNGKEVSVLKRLVGEVPESKLVNNLKELEYIK